MESLYLLILLFFIILIVFPLGINGKVFYSLKSNQGAFSINLWKIKLKTAKVKVKGNQIFLISNGKRKNNEIALSEPQLKFLKFFNEEVKDKVKLKSVYAYSRIGLEDPAYSAIFSSVVSNVILAIFSYLKSKKKTASFALTNHTSFTEFNFILALNINLSLSILDVLYSFVMSILRTRTDRILENQLQNQ